MCCHSQFAIAKVKSKIYNRKDKHISPMYKCCTIIALDNDHILRFCEEIVEFDRPIKSSNKNR